MTYTRARKDFEYLETVEPLDDWVEIQGDVIGMMENPTKKNAADFYERCIALWFMEKRHNVNLPRRAKRIKDRYGF